MLLEIFSFVSKIFTPAADLIDNLNTSAEEKLTLRNELAKIENSTTMKVIEYESKLLEARSNVIMAETGSDSWLAKNWRPLTMLTFVGIVVMYWFGYQPANATPSDIDNIFDLIKLGLTGYVVGRSGEKIAQVIKG